MQLLEDFPDARPVPSQPGIWATSSGKIISTRRGRARLLSPYVFRKLHLRVSILRNGKVEPARVAQLVCEAFHGPRPSPSHAAIHLDGIRTNNAALNLKWAVAAEKIEGQVRRGTQPRGERHGQHKLTDQQVIEIRAMASQGHSARYIAPRFHVCRGTIQFIIKGETWRHLIDGNAKAA